MSGPGKVERRHPVIRQCAICGKDIEYAACHVNRAKRHYCSRECAGKGRTQFHTGIDNAQFTQIEVQCQECGTTFLKKLGRATKNKWHFCSDTCRLAWTRHSEEWKDQHRATMLQTLSTYPRKTASEKMVAEELGRKNAQFKEQDVINGKFCVDFLLPDSRSKGVVIEVLGDYFHCNPSKYPGGPINSVQRGAIANDKRRVAYLEKCGYVMFGLWETEIRVDVATALKAVWRYLETGQQHLGVRFEHIR